MSLIITYAYGNELFMAWYSGNEIEMTVFRFRAFGRFAVFFWIMILFNSILPLTLFVPGLRRSISGIFIASVCVNIGMWLERFVIIVTSLARDFDPYNWGSYAPRWPEYFITIGSFSWFFLLFFIFIKIFPSVSIAQVKGALPGQRDFPCPVCPPGGSPDPPPVSAFPAGASKVMGIFQDRRSFCAACSRIRAEGFDDLTHFSPVHIHMGDELYDTRMSPVRYYTLAGAILGGVSGLALTIWTSIDAGLIVGGKPIVSLPPFLIISFELTILFAALATFAGFLFHVGLLGA